MPRQRTGARQQAVPANRELITCYGIPSETRLVASPMPSTFVPDADRAHQVSQAQEPHYREHGDKERAGNNFPEFSQSRPSCGKVS